MKENAIQVEELSKAYTQAVKAPGLWGAAKGLFWTKKRQVPAVQGLSFSVAPGEAVGLIGENGAGKSTTLKCLTGILKPSSGELKVLGHRPWRERRMLARKIGVVFGQRPQLIWDIAVRETFELNRVMYRVPDALFKETSRLASKLLELEPLMGVAVRQLSLGQRMRCDLACAMLHAPQLAFLDEPTIGLDVLAKEQARTLIKAMRRRFGTTLLLTTHDLKDITDICERVVLLDKGRLLFDGSLRAFEAQYARQRKVVADLERPVPAARLRKLRSRVGRLGGKLKAEGLAVSVAYEQPRAARALTKLLVQELDAVDLRFERADMESVVRKLYAGSKKARRD